MDAIITQFSPTAAPALNKGQRTASRILDAAEALFAQHGYDATSLRDIAARAGLQQPGLYKHFAGKDDLYRQVYERALKPVTDLMDEMLSAPDHSFAGLTDRMTDLLAHHPNIARLLMRATLSSDVEPDLVALDWVGRLDEAGAARYVLLADPAATRAEPLLTQLLLDPGTGLRGFWQRAGFGELSLGQLLEG